MSIQEMYTLLNSVGYPVAYRVFKTEQPPPFIVFYVDGTDNFFADNSVNKIINQWQIDLVTDIKDPEAESKIEKILTHWNKTEMYDSDEKIFITSYTFEETQ